MPFTTDKGSYTNLVYRVHFERVPLPHLTAGRNVGLFVIVTLAAEGRPVLLTSLHTCGCYLAFIPTSYLPPDSCPTDWRTGPQDVYGELLPGRLAYPPTSHEAYRPVVFVRDDTHRVMDVRVQSVREAEWRYDVEPACLEPMEALDRLPLDGTTTSFFETEGKLRGYVKGSRKPLEALFMGWLALDLRVGRDKKLADRSEMNTVLYTSLKPWRRKESDLWPFASLLRYWGWRL
jgi:hypothetical protein